MLYTFIQYLLESPNETNDPVSIAIYLPLPVDLTWQEQVWNIVGAVRDESLPTSLERVQLASLTPTQTTVSRPKVDAYLNSELVYAKPAIVLLDDLGRNILIDGHHRICSEVLKGAIWTKALTFTRAALTDWQSH